jgi:hypothetical protein
MQNLDLIANELFNKIRGRFPSVTIGDAEGNVTNEPKQARYFDFDFMNEGRPVGKISISLDDKNVAVVYGESLVSNETELTKNNWYDFLKELRMFARKRALTFDTRDITKSNLNSRDYKFLAKNRDGDGTMTESKMYGTSKISYQDFDGARLMIKHTEGIDQEAAGGRAKKVGSLYIESAEGERFKYPYKHITGARAMARHVAEGGNAYDDFGKHIVSMSEEMNKLRKFKSYMGRSAVMAESLADYVDVVKERIVTVKKTLESLQRPAYYKETFEAFAPAVMEDVPTDVAENWIDQLTIRQFNEELSDVFPYIYKLVSEASKAEELTAEDLMAEVAGPDKCWPGHRKVGTQKGTGKNAGKRVNKCKKIESEEEVEESGLQRYTGIKKYGKKGFEALQKAGREGASEEEKGKIKDQYLSKEEMEIESAFEEMMGQFAEQETNETQEGKVGTMALFVTDQDGGEHEVEVEVEIKNGKPEIVANTLPGPEDRLYWDDADIEQQAMDAMKNGDIEFDESFDPQSEPSKQEMELDKLNDVYEKGGEAGLAKEIGLSPQELDREMSEYGMEHGLHMDDDRDDIIQGYIEQLVDNMDEGNAYAHAVKKAKMNGKKKGDKVDGPDGDEITLEKDKKTPLGEFILSYYDKEAGEFPKGETAILTMVEKDYGNEFIEPAKQFITKVYQVTEEYREPETSPEFERMRELAGLR